MEAASSILIVGLAAFVLPLLARRLHVPGVVLEILFGILVGPAVLGMIEESEVVIVFAELGFLLLMFLSGFEIDFPGLRRQGSPQLLTGLAVFLVTLGLAWSGARLLDQGPFVTLVLATTSVGLVVPTLRNGGRVGTPLGQAILIAAVLSDFLTLIAATVYAMVVEHGWGSNLLNFPLLFVIVVLLLLLLKRMTWWYPETFESLFNAEDPEEMGIRTCLAFLFVFVGLSYALGVEPILGAFIAGSIFAFVFPRRGGLEQKVKGFSYGFLIPFFFIHVGFRFDVEVLMQPGVLVGALALLAVAALVKIGAATVLFARRFRGREVISAGVLLSARLSLVIAVAEMGVRLELIDRSLESQVVVLAIITSTLAPTLFNRIAPRVERAQTGQVS